MPSPWDTAPVISANKPLNTTQEVSRRTEETGFWKPKGYPLFFFFFTFWFLSLRWKNVFCKRLQSLLPLIVEPQVHFTPRFIFQEPLIFKIPLAVFLPQVVGHFCKRLGLNTRYFQIKDLRVTFPRLPAWLSLPTKPNHPVEEGAEQIPPGALAGTSTTKQYNATQRCQCQSRSHVASESRALYLRSWATLTG